LPGTVTWSLSPPVGTISAGGLYVAPASLAGPETVIVTATSVASPGNFATATISLTPSSGATCTFTLSPPGLVIGAGGGTSSVTVTASGNSCPWGAWDPAGSFSSITAGGSGTGNGTVTFNIPVNTGPERFDIVEIAGQAFEVFQAGAGSLVVNTSPPGLQFTIDKQPAQTGPMIFTLPAGSHTIAAPASQIVGTTQYAFASWSDGGAATHSITLPGPSTLTATFTAVGQVSGTPAPMSAGAVPPPGTAPPTGAAPGLSQLFSFTFSDSVGYQNLAVTDVLINNVLDGRKACYLAIVPSGASSATVYLVDDAGDAGGPFAGGMTVPGNGSISNSQCSVSASGSSVITGGNLLTVQLAITFSSGFAGNKVVYAAAREAVNNSGWQALSTWQVMVTSSTGLSVITSYPWRSTSLGPTPYTFSFNDTKGRPDISVVNVLINSAIDGRHGCYVAYVQSSNTVYLVDDAGDAGGPFAGGLTLPSNASISNSQCTISSVSVYADPIALSLLTLNLSITFNGQNFAGNQVIYGAVRSNTANSDWQAIGTAGVP